MELSSDGKELVSVGVTCVPERTVAYGGNLYGKLHPEKTLAWLVDALVFKLSTNLVVAQENKLLVQEVNGASLSSKTWEVHNPLVALLVFAENFNFSRG